MKAIVNVPICALLAAPIADALTFCLSLLLVWREFTAWRRKGWIER